MEVSYLVGLSVAVAVALAIVLVILFVRGRRGPRVVPPVRPPGTERVRRALQVTRERLVARLEAALGRSPGDVERVLPDLEEALVSSDVGVRTSAELVERVRSRLARGA